MMIYGLQKLTLLDYPGKVACTIFTGGCNFCCPFCHNASLVIHTETNRGIDETEIFAFLKKRIGILDGVCISGGEPLFQPDILKLLSKIKEMGFAVKLDTNGSFPEVLKDIVQKGLADYIAMDIKNSIENYPKTIGIKGYDTSRIEESAAFLMTNIIPYEFRTTVVREYHCSEDFVSIGKWLKNASFYYLQSFVDSGDVIKQGLTEYSKTELEEFANILRKSIPSVDLRGI